MTKIVGEAIKARRIEVGMTKSGFARKLGCSPQNIDSLEIRKSIDFELAQKICVILEFDLFENYRVYQSDHTKVELELRRKLQNVNEKYISVLEKYNELIEKLHKTTSLTP